MRSPGKKAAVFLMVTLMLPLLFVSGCEFATVPPAYKGKILTVAGYTPEVLPTSRMTLWGRDSLVLIETGTATLHESMKVIMKDKMELAFDVKFRVRIDGSNKVLNTMFNDIIPAYSDATRQKTITLLQVYNTYGKMIVRNIAREVLSDYTVMDVAENYKVISDKLYTQLTKSFLAVPLQVSDSLLGAIQYPAIVTTAIEKAKAREMEIEEQKAKVEIAIEKKLGEEKLAIQEQKIRMIKANTIAKENKLIAGSISDKYLKYKSLEVQEAMASNKAAVFFPYESFGSLGVQTRIANHK